MEDFTPEELEFFKSQGLNMGGDVDDTAAPVVVESEPVTAESETDFDDGTGLPTWQGGTQEEWDVYVKRLVAENTPQDTGPAPIKDTRDSFTYDNLYGSFPDPTTGEVKTKPDLSIYDRVGAAWYNTVQPEGSDPQPSQIAKDQYDTDIAQWSQATRDLFEGQSFYTENGKRVYDRMVPVNADGEPVTGDEAVADYRMEKVLIPDPIFDASAFNRVIEESGRTLYQEFGGLLTEGSLLEESEFAASRPDLDQAGGEAIATTILTLAAPAGAAQKVVKYGGKFLKYVGTGFKSAEIGKKSTVAANGIGTAIAEAIVSSEGDEGLVVKGSKVSDILPNISDAAAEDLAMVVDSMILNGVMDGALSVLVGSGKFLFSKTSAGVKLANKEALKTAVRDGTVLEVVKYLDPEFVNLNPVDMKLRLRALAGVLNDNRIINLSLGDATRAIDTDTTNALMMGSEAYIRETRAGMKDTLSEVEFEEFVMEEAAKMSTSMIGLFRSQQSNPLVQAGADRIPDEIGEFMTETAGSLAGEGRTIDQAAQNLAEDVVRASDLKVSEIASNADDVARQTDEILAAQATVVEDNPIVQDLIAENTGNYGLFNTNNAELRQELTDIVASEGYAVFKSTMDEVDATYRALPEASIDAELLRNQLLEITRAADALDGSGGRAKTVLSDVFEGFAPQRVGTRTDPMPVVGDAPSSAIMETPDQVIERLTQEVSFKDLYDLKARLASVIDSYSGDRTIQRRLIAFRNHITDAKDGQLAHVIATSEEGVSAAYRAADNEYKLAMSKFTNSEPIKRLTGKMQDMRRFDTERGQIPGEFKRNEPDVILGSDQFVDEVVGDQTGTLMSQLGTMLSSVRPGTELNGSFRALFRAQAANALRDAVQSGAAKGTDTPENLLFEAFRPVREQLQALGDTDLLNDVTEAYDQIQKAYGNLGDIKLANDELIKSYGEDVLRAQEGIVGMLIDTPGRPNPTGVFGPVASTPTSSARTKLAGIMGSENSENRIKELMDKIATLPDQYQRDQAVDALKAISLENIGTRLIGASPTAMKSGTKARGNVSLGAVKKLSEDEASNLLKSINVVYGQNSEMSDSIITLVNTMYDTSIPSRLKTSQAGSDTIINAARDSNIRDAVSTAILLTAGYMNPTAAMLRRMTSVPVAEAEMLQKTVAAHTLATIVANRKDFETMLKLLADGNEVSAKEIAIKIAAETGNASVLGLRYEFRVQEEDIFGEEDAGTIDRDMMQFIGYQ
jgi:hypothetical protein